MNIFSAFDGISCARLALERANIKVEKYYASEIDKFALAVANHHYPFNINLGDIRNINVSLLPEIDLMIGGFPCQSFSVAGDKLEFNDARGRLFFDMMSVFNQIKPKFFIFENVRMKNKTRDTVSRYIGVDAIEINSNKFSAQNRKRLYWTNIPVNDIIDAGIYLTDILDYNLIGRPVSDFRLKRSLRVNANDFGILVEQRTESAKEERKRNLAAGLDYCARSDKEYVVRSDGKSNAVMTSPDENIILQNGRLRKLSVLECERLQTLPDNYTFGSERQRYKMIGNGFTVDVVAHLLRGINGNIT